MGIGPEIINTILGITTVWAFLAFFGPYLVRKLDRDYYEALTECDYPEQYDWHWEMTILLRYAFMWVWAIAIIVLTLAKEIIDFFQDVLVVLILIVILAIYLPLLF